MLRDDGTMGEEESQLEITIGSPWYSSWWAILCYILLLVAIVWWREPLKRLAQRAHRIKNRQNGDANVGEDGEPHVGEAEGGEQKDADLDEDGDEYVLLSDEDGATGDTDGRSNL